MLQSTEIQSHAQCETILTYNMNLEEDRDKYFYQSVHENGRICDTELVLHI